jgi:type VI protein secretion system component VasF
LARQSTTSPASSRFAAKRRTQEKEAAVNRIIWLVGAVVIVLFVLGYFGLR